MKDVQGETAGLGFLALLVLLSATTLASLMFPRSVQDATTP